MPLFVKDYPMNYMLAYITRLISIQMEQFQTMSESCLKFTLLWEFEPRHEISNNVVCATGSLIKVFASRLNIIWLLSYWPNSTWSFKLERRLQRLVWVYSCKYTTLLEVTCHGSFIQLNIFPFDLVHFMFFWLNGMCIDVININSIFVFFVDFNNIFQFIFRYTL